MSHSYNKIMIGKTHWKNVVLPGVLYASSILTWTWKEIDELQRLENQVWRQVLGGQRFTLVVALQGEIGASMMKYRDMKNKLKMLNHLKNSESSLLRAVAERIMEVGSGGYIKQVE